MIKYGRCIVVIIALGLPGLAQAEIYKYLDEEGKIQFTDNLANVPAGQRNQVEEYEEVVHHPVRQAPSTTDEEAEDVDEGTSQENDRADKEEKGSAEGVGDEVGAGDLDESGERLRVEYEGLMNERAELDQAASRPLPPMEQERLVQTIEDFNERMRDFEIRREAHNNAVEAHNARVEQQGQSSQGEGSVE